MAVAVVAGIVFAHRAAVVRPADAESENAGVPAVKLTNKPKTNKIPKPRKKDPVVRERPNFAKLADAEEVKLSAAYRKLLDDLQAALDADDYKTLIKLVHRMQKSDEWPDGIPEIMHKSAIDALKWFGAKTAPELAGYLALGDEDLVSDALDAMLETLGDWSLSDAERGDLLANYVKVVTDSDTLESMINELNNMRPTIRAETALKIWDSGNQEALAVLKENLEFYFDIDDVEVIGREHLEQYLKDAEQAYQDDPDLAEEDEEFYGGEKE